MAKVAEHEDKAAETDLELQDLKSKLDIKQTMNAYLQNDIDESVSLSDSSITLSSYDFFLSLCLANDY